MAGNLIGQDEGRILPVMVLMIAVGALIGFLNGVGTTLLKVPSFIVTLGMFLALGGLVKYLTGGAATGNPVDEFRQIGRGGITGRAGRRGHPVLRHRAGRRRRARRAADAVVVRAHPAGRRRQPGGGGVRRHLGVVDQDLGVHALVAVGHRRGHPAGRVRRRAPVGRPGVRVPGHHGRRARRGRAGRWPGLGALGGGRRVRPRAAPRPAHLPRRRVDVAQHRAGHHHHPRRGRLGPCVDSRASPALPVGRPIWKAPQPRWTPLPRHHPGRAPTQENTDAPKVHPRAGSRSAAALLLAVLTACSQTSEPNAGDDPTDTATSEATAEETEDVGRGDRVVRPGASSTSRTSSAGRRSRVTPRSRTCSTSTAT